MLLHFAAILITFCGDYYILRRNTPPSRKNDKGIARRFLTQPYTTEKVGFGGRGEFFFGWPLRTDWTDMH